MTGLIFFSKPRLFLTIVFLFVLGLAIYSNVLGGEFLQDDYRYIIKNPAVTQDHGLVGIWNSFNTRFWVGVTFALDYKNYQLHVFGYHWFSIIVHFFNSVLVYIFSCQILLLVHKAGDYTKISFLTAVLFLCHPVQTQAVSYIAQRATLMVTGFYLLTHILYIKGRTENKPGWLWLAMFTLVMGLLTKENAITIGVSLVMLEVYFLNQYKAQKIHSTRWLVSSLLLTALFPAVFSLNQSNAAVKFKHLMGVHLFEWKVLLTELNVLITYLRLFFWPVGLRSDYYYPVTQNILELRTIGSILLIIALLIAMVRFFKNYRLVSFCILWFFLTKSVEFAGVTFGLRNLIYENWLYLSMVGLCLLSAAGITAVLKTQWLYKLAVLMLVTVLSVTAHARNEVWVTELGHYQDLVLKEPGYPSAYLGLSDAYWRKGQIDPAIFYLKKAVALKPDFSNGHNNLGILYSQKGMNQKALYHFKKVVEIDPDFYGTYQNLGYLAFINGDYDEAIRNYQRYLEYRPDTADCYYYIGMSYFRSKNKSEARKNLIKAQELYRKLNQALQVELLDEKLRML
ncbi:MAG: tetratricopeptide repeat protein [Candidatus Omnitrophota bacterium]